MSHVDPGLDERAQEAAQNVDHAIHDEEKLAEREEQDFLDPGRWWFASTACPLIAGTFGPMANTFSICALVEKWRIRIPPGADEGHGLKIEDPKWLIAINSVSLVFALVANLALLLNMARRLSFAIAQPITIIGWYLASILLIVLVSLASTSIFRHHPPEQHALSQAYYYGIIAAGIYFVISSLMVVTVFGAYRGHYPKDFRLTVSQRSLMLQTIAFMMYLLLGALVFSNIEGWQYLDGVFWADFTLLTVGIGGEFVPKTHTGRSLLFPYAIGGILMVGLVVGSIRSLVLDRGKQKMSARFVENNRQKVLSSFDPEKRTLRLGIGHTITFAEQGLSESQRREQEFLVMRKIQEKAERKRRYTALTMSATAALLLWLLGAVVFMHSEKNMQGWSYFVSLYFTYTTLLTIGYGDFTPTSNSGKAFFVFWTLLAVPTLTILISNMGDTVIRWFKEMTLWMGSLTFLPDEDGVIATLKAGTKRLKRGKLFEANDQSHLDLDRMAEHIEDKELAEAEEAGEHGDTLERDIHWYHFVLTKEIRRLMKDVDASPPKQYSYQEWKFFLKLIGQDEADTSCHRKPKVENGYEGRHSPDLGAADGNEKESDERSWSWLGVRSPLMGNKSESQWLLQRLAATLESEMRKMRSPDAKKRAEPPPISMSDLRPQMKGSSDSGSGQNLEDAIGTAEIRRRQQRSE